MKRYLVNMTNVNLEEKRNELIKWYEIPADEATDEMIMDEVYNQAKEDWYELSKFIESEYGYKHWILCNNRFNRYFGSGVGYQMIDNLVKFVNNLDCDVFDIYEENGHLYIHSIDHDGENTIEVKLVRDRGLEMYNNWNYGISQTDKQEWDILNMVFTNNLWSKLTNISKLY